MTHLKSQQYYSDLYDRYTVEQCRRTEHSFKGKDMPTPEDKGVSKEEAAQIKITAMKWYLHMETGERYLNKDKMIREWVDADRKRDDLLESAQAPEDIRCLTCRSRLTPTSKYLSSWMDKEDRILFMYDCPNKCLPRRAFFSDGEEWRIKPHLCLHCETPLDSKEEDDGKKMITTRTCPKCGYVETEEYEWSHKEKEEYDKNFAKDRDRFCLSDEEGRKYQDEKYGLGQLAKLAEEFKKTDEERAEKLKANPKGFHLDGAGYTCFICGDHTPEGDNWYDEFGIKCLVCQKAIDDGEIPASLAKEKESWYSKWELESAFNLTGQTLKKWTKEGILKARTVSKYDKSTHTEFFLLEDNKDFLPPKKLLEGRPVKTRKDGKDWFSTQKWYEFLDPFEHLKGYKIMDYMRIVPPEEMKAREEEKKRKWEEKRARRELKRKRKK